MISKIKKHLKLIILITVGVVLILIQDLDIEPFFSATTFFYCVILAYFIITWLFKQVKTTLKLKTEKHNTELIHLQSQVNPHFFFNMLNNLYGLVEKDSKKAQELILKLSDMMRYSIYEGQKSTVPLEDEVAYLENYIELHKMRYHKEIEVNFNIHIHEEGYEVMPLLFIILLENAFKHGVENLRENAFVNVILIARDREIIFAIENNFDLEEIPDDKKVGIGLKNLNRRLELVYPKKHNLSFSKKEEVYKAQLSIKL